MTPKKIALRVGIALATSLALILNGFVPVAQATVYRSGYYMCPLNTGRRVTSWAQGREEALARAGNALDQKGGTQGPYEAFAKSDSSEAFWVAGAAPSFMGGGPGCSM